MTELFDNTSEIAFLSILLKHPEMILDNSNVQSFMFSSTQNRKLFGTMYELSEQQLTPDIPLLIQYLKTRDRLLEVGDVEYLDYLNKQDYRPTNLSLYSKQISDAYKARMMLSVAAEIREAKITSDNVDSIINTFKNKLDDLMQAVSSNSLKDIKDILKQTWKNIGDRIKNPGIQGISLGIKSLDVTSSGMCGKELWVIGARPSMGKSAVVCNLAVKQGLLGIPTTIFSIEMSEGQLVERMLAILSKVPLTGIRLGTLSQKEVDKLAEAYKLLNECKIQIDDTPYNDPDQIYTAIRRAVKFHNSKVIYIDYIQLLCDRGDDATSLLGKTSRRLKLLAKELDITIVMLSQLNREVEKRDNKRPIMSDLKQSGSLEEDGDVIIGLYRDFYYNKNKEFEFELEAIFLKQRNGPPGSVILKFLPDINLVEDN